MSYHSVNTFQSVSSNQHTKYMRNHCIYPQLPLMLIMYWRGINVTEKARCNLNQFSNQWLHMIRLCPSCNSRMLHKYIIGGADQLLLHDHVPRFSCVKCERLGSWQSAYDCKNCGLILIDRNDSPIQFQKKVKCPYCQKNHNYTDKDLDSDSMVLCKSCLREFILKVDKKNEN